MNTAPGGGAPSSSTPAPAEASATGADRAPDAPMTTRQKVMRAVATLASFALAAAIIAWLIPAALDTTWASILASFREVPLVWVGFLLAIAVIALLVDSIGFQASYRGVRWRTAVEVNAIAQAITLAIPFGSTLSLGVIYGRLRRAGLAVQRIASGTLLASVADVLATFAIPVLALAALAFAPLPYGLGARAAMLIGAILAVALVALILRVVWSEKLLASLMGRVQAVYDAFCEGFKKPSQDLTAPVMATRQMALENARGATGRILGAPTVARLVQGAAFIAWCTWAFDLGIGPTALFAVYALSKLLAFIPLTPGGIGVVDVGVAWALVQLGAPTDDAVTAALIFTLTQTIFPAVLGALALPLAARSASAEQPANTPRSS
ncbi:MAG: lysylphosphatidylglycerol synthase domain-containing protein [Dermabacter sp.]|nr:lysylphosphatidylglycerol synthase domain-containing protein [Dermabacter sp.]